MQDQIARVEFLIAQRRYADAQAEAMRLIAQHPDAPQPHALLAWALMAEHKKEEALAPAQRAVGLGPEEGHLHVLLANVLLALGRIPEADQVSQEALRLEPTDPDVHALRARVLVKQGKIQDAIQACDAGLACDPADQDCLNLRATLLTMLGRYAEAQENMTGALRQDPNDERAHANQGWQCLHMGDQAGAEMHFREALRLSPGFEWARMGMLESLKTRNVVYRYILSGLLRLGTLPQNIQFTVMIGLFLIYQVMRSVSSQNPGLAPYMYPLLGLYILFVFVTWAWRPLSNVMLFFHPLGRLAMTGRERWGAGVCAGLLLVGAGWYGLLAYTGGLYFGLLGLAWCLAVIPVAVAFEASTPVRSTIAAGWGAMFIVLAHAMPFVPAGQVQTVGIALTFAVLVWFWGVGQMVNR